MKLFEQYKGLRKEIYILCFGLFVTNLGSLIWPLLTLIMNQKLHMSASTIATYVLIVQFFYLPVGLIGGKLADKYSKKKVIIFCDIIAIICYFLAGFNSNSFMTFILIVIASIFESTEAPAFNAIIADYTASQDREKAYSLQYLCDNVGYALAPTLGGLLFNNYLWLAFFINAASILISTLFILFNIKDQVKIEATTKYEKSEDHGSTLHYIFNHRVILLLILVSLTYGICFNEHNYLIPFELVKNYENGSVLYGTLESVNCIICIIFTAIFTAKLKAVRDIDRLMLCQLFILSGLAIFAAFIKKPILLYVAITLFTFGEIIKKTTYSAFLTRRIPANYRGRIGSIEKVFCIFTGLAIQKGISALWDKNSMLGWGLVFVIGFSEILLVRLMKYYDQKDFPDFYIKEKESF